ncbi:hypothetical protein F4804DRAFT_319729 [Jackrogersella minutella]|nr:hypothetical protein F4804DRAFT_319729 [Jackrogersella minutella]
MCNTANEPRETEGLPRDGRALHEFGLLCILLLHNYMIIKIWLVVNANENDCRDKPRLGGYQGLLQTYSPNVENIAARLSAERLTATEKQAE